MKKFSLIALLALTYGSAAHAGYGFPIDITERVCLYESIHPSAPEALQEVTAKAALSLKTACEDAPGASGAKSTLTSVEIQDKGACGFGLYVYEYRLTGKCYIP